MKNILFLLLLISISNYSYASIFQVGSTQLYSSPNALYLANILQNGDTIDIDAETYTGVPSLAVWYNDSLLIRGVGGKPHLIADGEYIMGKGIWVLAGDNIIVENIEFSGAIVPDHNGAGIRLDGSGLILQNCYFHDNENGILTSNPYSGDILIEYCEFANNGYGDGYTHNLYVGHVNKLVFRYNYSHHADVGHNLKSRANENYILYNRIMDEESGNSSRLIDLPNGGFSIIMGNLLMQGTNAINNNLIGYGKEGLSNTNSEVYIINNTFTNYRTASCIFVDIETGTTIANISNNIFAGSGDTFNGNPTVIANNIIESIIDSVYFIDELNYNYRLNSGSMAIDSGIVVNAVNGYSLTPEYTYEHPTSNLPRIISNSIIDVGAYEYETPVSIIDFSSIDIIIIYPNPTSGRINIEANSSEIDVLSVYSQEGKLIRSNNNQSSIDISDIQVGYYFINIKLKNGMTSIHPIIKIN